MSPSPVVNTSSSGIAGVDPVSPDSAPVIATDPAVIDVFLQPGEMFVGTHDYRVRTLLGSCVSMTLWHPRHRIGAMSHCLLAEPRRSSLALDARYCADAFELMTIELRQLGVDVRHCEAKLFGGGQMFPRESMDPGQAIGSGNAAYARRLLRNAGLPIRALHLSGMGYRQIVFDLGNGSVWVRHVPHEPSAGSGGKGGLPS